MNILYIAQGSHLGGANLSLLGLIDELSDENNIYVATPIRNGLLVDELKKRNITYFHVHYFWWLLAPANTKMGTWSKKVLYRILLINNYFCAWRLCQVAKKYQIDIVHTNSSVVNTGGILAHILKIPHVWHVREFGQEDFNFFSVIKDDKLYEFMNKNSSYVIAISHAIYNKFAEKIDEDKLRMVYNGVNEDNIQRKSQIKYPEAVVHYLISGRISKAKGQREALEAVKMLVHAGWSNLHLFIAGEGDCTVLKDFVLASGIAEYVTFLGRISDMPALRAKMDVELVCSRCEGFGRVTVEAMMSSNPVIGTNTGGTPELIEDGKSGFLYSSGKVEELAEKMKIFLESPEQIRVMGDYAFEKTSTVYTKKRNAQSIKQIYQELITYYRE